MEPQNQAAPFESDDQTVATLWTQSQIPDIHRSLPSVLRYDRTTGWSVPALELSGHDRIAEQRIDHPGAMTERIGGNETGGMDG